MCALAFVLISYTIQVQYEIVVQEEILWISGGGRKMIKEGIMDDISIDGSIALHTLTSENPKSRKGNFVDNEFLQCYYVINLHL